MRRWTVVWAWVVTATLAAGCACAAEPAPQDRFIDELTEMVFGRREAIDLTLGYPIVTTGIVDAADRRVSGSESVNLNPMTLEWLDATYTQFTFDLRPHSVNAGQQQRGATAERLGRLREHAFALVQGPQRSGPARSGSALAILSYSSGTAARLRDAVARLHGPRRAVHVPVQPGCDLFHSAETDTGYVDSLVLLVADPQGTLGIADEGIARCIFAAHLFNIGFADAVISGRFRSFPIEIRGACNVAAAGPLPQPCQALFGRRAHLGVASEMVRSGRLRPGRVGRRAFRDAAREEVARIGWPIIAAAQDYEAYARRTWHDGPPRAPTSPVND